MPEMASQLLANCTDGIKWQLRRDQKFRVSEQNDSSSTGAGGECSGCPVSENSHLLKASSKCRIDAAYMPSTDFEKLKWGQGSAWLPARASKARSEYRMEPFQ
eukprot:54633-Pelagomonas_calceolata.AAC.5